MSRLRKVRAARAFGRARHGCAQVLLIGGLIIAMTSPLPAESARYEQNLQRLSEILGAMHYLQQICKAFTNKTWRNQMIELIKVEKAKGEKEARLTASFNRGYSKYQDWFTSCTDGAHVEIERFTIEGSELSTWLARNRR